MADETKSIQTDETEEKEELNILLSRIEVLKDYRKQKLPGLNRSIEDIWRDADFEYTPHDLDFNKNGVRFESNEETGLRSKLVKVGDPDWQSNSASPDLYVKVSTAVGILNDLNPEAVFVPKSKKYEANTKLVQGNWKNSWEDAGSKQQMKNFMFNQAKYGTGYLKTYPKIIKMDKQVLSEYYPDDLEKNKYNKQEIIKFNDIYRESLSPWQVWMSEATRIGDYFSMDDWYYEKDFSIDKFKKEFKGFKNVDQVKAGMTQTNEDGTQVQKTENTVTIGFYENQITDKYQIIVPSSNILLYSAPLLNDDGLLSLSFAPWTLRDDRSPYGIGIFEIIRQDKTLYDKLQNMTMDQLVLSIYKMFFYKGTDMIGDNGTLVITPGVGSQVIDPTSVNFLNIPGPGPEAWKGMDYLQNQMNLNSGVNAQLSAQFTGKTLGQDMQAKEAALERMKTPLDYIVDCLQQEAYITLSWQKQTLSTPEILEYTDVKTLKEALEEFGLTEEEITGYLKELANPKEDTELFYNEDDGEPEEVTDELTGEVKTNQKQKHFANVYKEVSLNLDKDEKGELIESKDMRFYRFGLDLSTKRLDWKGYVVVKPQSILAPSKELMKRQKLDLFNLVQPSIQGMLGAPQFIPVLLPPIKQILKVYDEDVNDWIDEEQLSVLYKATTEPKQEVQEPPKISMSISFEDLGTLTKDGMPITLSEQQKQVLEKYLGIKVEDPLFIDGQTGEGQPEVTSTQSGPPQMEGEIPQTEPIVPRDNIDPGTTNYGSVNEMNI